MVSSTNGQRTGAWHAGFLAMLPAIRCQLKVAFRDLDPEARTRSRTGRHLQRHDGLP